MLTVYTKAYLMSRDIRQKEIKKQYDMITEARKELDADSHLSRQYELMALQQALGWALGMDLMSPSDYAKVVSPDQE